MFPCIISFLVVVITTFCFIIAGCVSSGVQRGCGNGNGTVLIDYPFCWYQDYYSNNVVENSSCKYPGLGIKCEDGRAVMNISHNLYYVLNINYTQKLIRMVDVDIDGQECPHLRRNFSQQLEIESTSLSLAYFESQKWTIFYNCSSNPDDRYFSHIPCLDYNYHNSTTVPLRSYAFLNHPDYTDDDGSIPNCEETVVTMTVLNSFNYTASAKFGFDLYWFAPVPTGVATAVGVGGLLVILLFIYRCIYRTTFYKMYYSAISCWKNKINPTDIEEFLESYGVALQRFSYSEIKKMTNSFKDTLGQGGYGSVFQGKLNRDGLLVAVKVLNKSKGNGEDFINEVATIGRTNHVNVVNLLGFCTEGSKRALVYEYMSNGSLERFIYNDKISSCSTTHTTLGWDKLYQIALGIARGLEYLHCRCNTRILHFDIKPHNILLDQEFCPKISDFGLAKLCPTKESIVSMVGARGTMGYIAPEVTCRNLGGVSHKSDVYSYGMMVLEMIGGRKNVDVTVENMSGIYFPHWIYNQLKQNSKVEEPQGIKFDGAAEILKEATAKKMIIVALWCIQTHPTNRPSMTKVVEMFEGNNETIQMPPNPSLDPLSLSSSSSSSS